MEPLKFLHRYSLGGFQSTEPAYESVATTSRSTTSEAALSDILTREELKDRIFNMLFTGNLDLLATICRINQFGDGNAVAHSIISLLQSNHLAEKFVMRMLSTRIANTSFSETKDLTNVLRDNSMTVILLTAYAKIEGASYLKEVLTPAVAELMDIIGLVEINPESLPKGEEDAKQNLNNLVKAIDIILNHVTQSKETMPSSFRRLCNHLRSESFQKLTAETALEEHVRIQFSLRLVGSFIFLRYFCPAITSPQLFGITDRKNFTPEERRGLILTAKVFINLGTESDMAAKEEYMIPLSQRLNVERDRMREYLTFISSPQHLENAPPSDLWVKNDKFLDDAISFFNKNLTKIEDLVKSNEEQLFQFEELKSLLQRLSAPGVLPAPTLLSSSPSPSSSKLHPKPKPSRASSIPNATHQPAPLKSMKSDLSEEPLASSGDSFYDRVSDTFRGLFRRSRLKSRSSSLLDL